jgi:hypothetical protein
MKMYLVILRAVQLFWNYTSIPSVSSEPDYRLWRMANLVCLSCVFAIVIGCASTPSPNTSAVKYIDFLDVPAGQFQDDREDVLKAIVFTSDTSADDGFVAIGNTDNRIGVAKFLNTGNADTSFGGYYSFNIGQFDSQCPDIAGAFHNRASGQTMFFSNVSVPGITYTEQASDVLVNGDRIIFAGTVKRVLDYLPPPEYSRFESDFLVGRLLLSSGKRDCDGRTDFGDDGHVSINFDDIPGFSYGTGEAEANALTLEDEADGGRIVVVGNVRRHTREKGSRSCALARIHNNNSSGQAWVWNQTTQQWIVSHYHAGDLDSWFGYYANPGQSHGRAILTFGYDDVTCDALLTEPHTDTGWGANIIVAGTYAYSEQNDVFMFIARIDGKGHVLDFFPGPRWSDHELRPRAMTRTTNGKILVAGDVKTWTDSRAGFVLQFDPATGLDTNFGPSSSINNLTGPINDVGVDSSGRIMVVGTIASTRELYLARYTANGDLDTSFYGTGQITIDGITDDQNVCNLNCAAIAVDDQRTIVAGIKWRATATNPGDPNNDFAYASYPH